MSGNNNIPCAPGSLSILAVNNADCACVGIKSVVNNQPLAQSFTITLTNGQSITLPLIQGASGTIAMQVANGYIQYSANGGAWINLIALSSLVGARLIYNAYPNTTTTGTGSEEALTTVAIPGGTLNSVGDELYVRAVYTCGITTPNTNFGQYGVGRLNGSKIIPFAAGFMNADLQYIQVESWITMLSGTTAEYKWDMKGFNQQSNLLTGPYNVPTGGLLSGANNLTGYAALTGVDFTTSQNLVALGLAANSGVAQVMLNYLRIEYTPI